MAGKSIKNFNDYLKVYEADELGSTQDQINTIKDIYQVYQTNKSKVDTLYNKYKNNEEADLSDMDQEFDKVLANLENDDLLRKYYLSRKLEIKKIKLEQEVKQIMEELKKNEIELAEMMKNLS